MKRFALISSLVIFCIFSRGYYAVAYELEKIFGDSNICCPMGLADVDGDKKAEWLCLMEKEPQPYRRPWDTRIYLYKYDIKNNVMKLEWKSLDIGLDGGGDAFDGKINFGDLDGRGIKEIVVIGWRSKFGEEYRGTSYEGNICVFGWNGKEFSQQLKTTKYYFSDMTRPEEIAIADVFGTGKDAIIISQYEKLLLLEKEKNAFKERLLVSKERPAFIDFRVGDVDNDGKNEIICGYNLPNERATKIFKYDGKEFEILYQKTFVDKEKKLIRLGDIRETKDGKKVVAFTYDGKERYFKFIPKTERYPGESAEEKDNKLKEIEVKNPIFKEEPAKYPGLALPIGEHHFADIDGDGKDELINCGPNGVSIYKIK